MLETFKVLAARYLQDRVHPAECSLQGPCALAPAGSSSLSPSPCHPHVMLLHYPAAWSAFINHPGTLVPLRVRIPFCPACPFYPHLAPRCLPSSILQDCWAVISFRKNSPPERGPLPELDPPPSAPYNFFFCIYHIVLELPAHRSISPVWTLESWKPCFIHTLVSRT